VASEGVTGAGILPGEGVTCPGKLYRIRKVAVRYFMQSRAAKLFSEIGRPRDGKSKSLVTEFFVD